jgi:hypothetical protein
LWVQFLEAVPGTLIITTFTMGLIPTEQRGRDMILIIFINVWVKNAWNYKFTSPVSPWPVAQACSFNPVTHISHSVLFRLTPSYLIDSKLPFHQHVDCIVSPLIKS